VLQGLFLDTDGDRLVGRAENGMLWTWDLTRTLGWQSLAPPAQQRLGSGGDAALDTAGDGAGCRVGGGGSCGGAAESWAQPGNGAGCWLSAASLPEEVLNNAVQYAIRVVPLEQLAATQTWWSLKHGQC
jgi:hypothetical protein